MKNGKEMTAEDFFRMSKDGRKLENEYFIALDKTSFFKLMEDYAAYKSDTLKSKNIRRNFL